MTSSTPITTWLRWLVFLALGAGVAGFVCWSLLSGSDDWPPYEAETILLIELVPGPEGRPSMEGIEIAQRTLQVAITREPIRSAAVDRLDGDWNVEEVAEQVRVEVPEGVPMITISARDADANVAADIANAFAAEAAAFQSPLGGGSVLAPAKVPESPVLTSYLLVVVAAMVGALIAGAAIWIADRLRLSIRNAADAERLTGVPFLGVVAMTYEGRFTDTEEHDWVFVRLMNSLEQHHCTVLFTSPKPAVSQHSLLLRLLSTSTRPTGLVARSLDPFTASPAPKPLPSKADRGLRYSVQLPGDHALGEVHQPCSTLEILDGPPVLNNPATVLRAPRFDAVVLVLEAGATRRRDAERAVSLLDEAGANLAGSVLVDRSPRFSKALA